MTAHDLDEWQRMIENTNSGLKEQFWRTDDTLETSISDADVAKRARLQNEKDALQCCLAICAEASSQARQEQGNLFEDINASNDAFQLIVSTPEELVSAKRVKAGPSAVQCF